MQKNNTAQTTTSHFQTNLSVFLSETHAETARQTSKFKRIRDVKALLNFESQLENDQYLCEMVKKVQDTFVNTDKYKRSPRNFAYKVIVMFTKRKLSLQYSWTGKKQRNGGKYHSLEKRSAFIGFILRAIQIKMPNFERSDLDDIFQSLCRNKYAKVDDTSSECSHE